MAEENADILFHIPLSPTPEGEGLLRQSCLKESAGILPLLPLESVVNSETEPSPSGRGQGEVVTFIGVLDDGAVSLGAEALDALRSARHVIAGGRLLVLLADHITEARHYDLTGYLAQVPGWIAAALANDEAVVVLATGDPLCHGIAGFLASKLDAARVKILPNLSTVQLAFAALGLPWQTARIVSVHAKDAGEWTHGASRDHGLYALAQLCRREEVLAVLTSPDNTPGRIARMLDVEAMADLFDMAVAERLSQPQQRVTGFLSVAEVAGSAFADPNVVILKRKIASPSPVLFGVSDADFRQRKPEKGLITKREVRAVSLARLQLRRDSTLWDIGAGSGSVGLEAARLCPDGEVYAIEKNADDIANIEHNHRAWGLSNYRCVHGKAPQGLDAWPDPDAVFIGGSGGELAELIELCFRRLKPGGWLVMNFVTLENLATAIATLKRLDATWDVCQLQAARSQPILDMQRLAAENPVWIISAHIESTAGIKRLQASLGESLQPWPANHPIGCRRIEP
ncbi:MAG: precorrin-6y C5,15-methyltransferase (decarboxylating) subunit CbiE [Methylomonas sp.]|nr:precorrin-6y C5,15-methyltransferase (decarboxylating) subunit CbiE [Methylomonas sp.]PPD21347.1 MAG: cobalamin biosynthesis bifunctional protein CbiET [Methylomonas sp.]PPD26912.1 MAG: cobalamin biosynthesis bifunctional protein CbiET [Methylomonas sp.]PPD38842.1 MAG: cobalamin biosynthesis bifunctional protein CbiET [Methylomonas sp.]PPD41724.1 MAG: cobalamin biosynthesis bifunctional protein CbiET [Methylomonas sp.]